MMQYHKAKKALGQNFLVDGNVAGRIVEAISPAWSRTVIEIGPGHGALTEKLLDRGLEVLAIEYDRDLCAELKSKFGERKGFSLIEADVLRVNFQDLIPNGQHASVVANLPYNISTPVLQQLIDNRVRVSGMVLMLQREVVARIAARPGNRERGYLSVMVQAHCDVENIFTVPPTAFRPVPEVWSSVARFEIRDNINLSTPNDDLFASFVSVCFAQKRKTILNNLRHSVPAIRLLLDAVGGESILLENAGVDPKARAEALEMREWARLFGILSGSGVAK